MGEATSGRTTLPEPLIPGKYRMGFVCTGNICRSPTAEVVMARLADEAELTNLTIDSCGIGDWHVGQPMDDRSAAILREAGYEPDSHRAQQLRRDWFTTHDVLIGMDAGHLDQLRRRAPHGAAEARIRLFGDFDPTSPGVEVPDPYYGDGEGFKEVLSMIERTCRALVPQLGTVLAGR